MNSKKNLVFLGMMGSGKSTLGFMLSKKLNLKFIDIDNLIEAEEEMTISNIFKIRGEAYFRELEEKITLKALKKNQNIISLGGGGFINSKIRNEVINNHISFWLNLESRVLLKRIKSSKKRPLVYKVDDEKILNLIKNRSKTYSKAKFKINCNNLTKTEIIKKIIKIYELS